MNQRHYYSFASILGLFLCCLSCGNALGMAITGKWQEVGGTHSRMEFLSDGNITCVSGNMQLAGTYNLLENNRLKINYGANIGSMIFEVTMSGDEMTLTEPNGKISYFTKAYKTKEINESGKAQSARLVDLTGKWLEAGGTQSRMEFLNDGNIICVSGNMQLAGTYNLLDNNRLKIDYGANIGSMIFDFTINGSELSLKEPNGKISIFKKAE